MLHSLLSSLSWVISVSFVKMRQHLQACEFPKSQNRILQFLEEVARGGFNELVPQSFIKIVVQFKIPAIFTVEPDGFGKLCFGSCGNMNWCSIWVDGDDGSCGFCGGIILGIVY